MPVKNPPPLNGGSGPAIANAGLYGSGAAGGGLGSYGAPNAGVVNQRKPVPRQVRPNFPLVTNDPGPLTPPPKPAGAIADDRFFHVGDGAAVGSNSPRFAGLTPGFTDGIVAYGGGFHAPPQSPTRSSGRSAAEDGRFFNVGGGAAPVSLPASGANEWQAYGAGSPKPGWLTPGSSWSPLPAESYEMDAPKHERNRGGGGHARGPLLPNNTAPAYGAGTAGSTQFMSPGWWHAANGEVIGPGQQQVANSPGWWHGQGEGQALNQAMAAQAQFGPGGGGQGGFLGGYVGGGGGGGGHGGGNYGNNIGDFVDAMNHANQRNADRQNNVSSGYEAVKNWIGQMYGNLGEQQRKDVNTTFDKEKGRLTQDMISRGLTASTVLDNMQKGNERTRSEALARLDDELTKNMVGATLPVWTKELDFLTDIKDSGPDLGLMAQLLQQANSAGNGQGGMGGYGGGGGAGIPITIDSGDIPYMQPMAMGYGGGGYGNGRGMTVPAGRALDNRLALLRRQQGQIGNRSPHSPITYGPGGPGMSPLPGGMSDLYDPGLAWA